MNGVEFSFLSLNNYFSIQNYPFMKKMLLVAIAGIAILSSCNKSYNCVCTSVKPDGTVVDQTNTNISDRTKNSATDDCAKRSYVNADITTTCLLN
jgi:hypothetical protein